MIIFFDFLMILSLIFTLIVIINWNPVYSLMCLIGIFVNTSILLLILEVEFLALIFIIVYVGAVAILFLFVIMMLNLRDNKIFDLYSSYSEIIDLFLILILFLKFWLLNISLINKSFNLLYYLHKCKVLFYIENVNLCTYPCSLHNSIIKLYFLNFDINIFSYMLYTKYWLLFITSGVTLLTSMLCANILIHNSVKDSKYLQ